MNLSGPDLVMMTNYVLPSSALQVSTTRFKLPCETDHAIHNSSIPSPLPLQECLRALLLERTMHRYLFWRRQDCYQSGDDEIGSAEDRGMNTSRNPLTGNTDDRKNLRPARQTNLSLAVEPTTPQTTQAGKRQPPIRHPARINPTHRHPGSNQMRSALLKLSDRQSIANEGILADSEASRAIHTADRLRLHRTYSNNQFTSLCDEFTDLCTAKQPFCLSIINSKGIVTGQVSLAQIRSRLANQEGQVLWTLNENGDLVLGMKSSAAPALKHSILANGNDALATQLEQSWDHAALNILSDWIPNKKHILENESKRVASAGLMKAQRTQGNDFELIIDNESGHFEPDAESLACLNRFHEPLKSLLSNESFRLKKITLSYYTPGKVA